MFATSKLAKSLVAVRPVVQKSSCQKHVKELLHLDSVHPELPGTKYARLHSNKMQASRADAARAVIFKASKMVVARVTPEAVLQSFPDFTEPQDEQFILALRDKVAEHLQAGFDVRFSFR
jgi:hypothetical protein